MIKHLSSGTFFSLLLAAGIMPLAGCSTNDTLEVDAGRAMDGPVPARLAMDARQNRHFEIYQHYHAVAQQSSGGSEADDGQPPLRHAILTMNATALSACSPHLLLVDD